MKNILLLIFIAILFLFSPGCTKEETISTNTKERLNNSTSIVAKWELRQMAGDIGTVNYASGNGSFLEFTDSTYSTTNNSIFVGGNHSNEGHYQIVADTSVINSIGFVVPSGQFSNRIILNKDTTDDKIFYQITGSKLIILSGFFPSDSGVKLTYEKQ